MINNKKDGWKTDVNLFKSKRVFNLGLQDKNFVKRAGKEGGGGVLEVKITIK